MRYSVLILILILAVPVFAGEIADEITRSDQYLSRIKAMITQEQEQAEKLQDAKQKKARELQKAEMELNYNEKLSKKLEQKLTGLNKDISFIQFRQQKLTSRQESLKQSIRSANYYLAGAGETELLEALILSDELSELTAGLQIIARVNTRLFDMVKELSDNKLRLDDNIAKLKETQKQVNDALIERKKVLEETAAKRTLVRQLYKMASEDEKIKQEYVALLTDKEQALEKKIKELSIAQSRQNEQKMFDGLGRDFDRMKGKLEWPIRGKVIEGFGTKKVEGFKGVIHKKGLKIEPAEEQVASVYDGVVMHTDTAWGLGAFVIVEHFGGYYTLYANLDEVTVKKNQKVHTGEVLGTIDVDRAANTPYLYFEIRIHDKAVDPINWLAS